MSKNLFIVLLTAFFAINCGNNTEQKAAIEQKEKQIADSIETVRYLEAKERAEERAIKVADSLKNVKPLKPLKIKFYKIQSMYGNGNGTHFIYTTINRRIKETELKSMVKRVMNMPKIKSNPKIPACKRVVIRFLLSENDKRYYAIAEVLKDEPSWEQLIGEEI